MALEGKTQELVSMALNMLGSMKSQEDMPSPCLEVWGPPSPYRTQSQRWGELQAAEASGGGGTEWFLAGIEQGKQASDRLSSGLSSSLSSFLFFSPLPHSMLLA